MPRQKPGARRRATNAIALAVAPLAAFLALSSSHLVANKLVPGVTGALAGAAGVYLLALHRGRRRTVAAVLISSWCVAVVGSAFLAPPSETHPLFDLSRPEGCLAYGFALGFGAAAVASWVNAGSTAPRPRPMAAGGRPRCRRVGVPSRPARGRSRCSPERRAEDPG